MRKKTIYLAGPMFDCNSSQISNWRESVKDKLGHKFNILDPTRPFSEGSTYIDWVERDKEDIDLSDVILVFRWKCSDGTAMEMNHAWNLGKTVVCVAFQEGYSPWITYHSDVIFKSLDEAITYLSEQI
jgi:nucleoside 2-deoxyribosyltransferase